MQRRQIQYIIIALLIAALLGGCSASLAGQEPGTIMGKNQGQAQYLEEDPIQTLNRTLSEASAVVYAQVVGKEKKDEATAITFDIVRTYAGDLGVSRFTVLDRIMTSTDISFDVGNFYILPIIKNVNLYRGEDEYIIPGSVFEYDNKENYIRSVLANGKELNLKDNSVKGVAAYVAQNSPKNRTIKGMEYVRSDNLKDIVLGSQCIVHIKIGDLFDSPFVDVYDVEVIKAVKGDATILEKAMFYKDTVKTGEEYVALFMIDHKGWGWFAAKDHCLIPIGDTAKVEEVLKLIEETK
ncbi:MAG: hypothetical protein PHO66_00160 [Eubacteriales bacterium]|nr:hypothetical protein [Eubacteriales bacterium]